MLKVCGFVNILYDYDKYLVYIPFFRKGAKLYFGNYYDQAIIENNRIIQKSSVKVKLEWVKPKKNICIGVGYVPEDNIYYIYFKDFQNKVPITFKIIDGYELRLKNNKDHYDLIPETRMPELYLIEQQLQQFSNYSFEFSKYLQIYQDLDKIEPAMKIQKVWRSWKLCQLKKKQNALKIYKFWKSCKFNQVKKKYNALKIYNFWKSQKFNQAKKKFINLWEKHNALKIYNFWKTNRAKKNLIILRKNYNARRIYNFWKFHKKRKQKLEKKKRKRSRQKKKKQNLNLILSEFKEKDKKEKQYFSRVLKIHSICQQKTLIYTTLYASKIENIKFDLKGYSILTDHDTKENIALNSLPENEQLLILNMIRIVNFGFFLKVNFFLMNELFNKYSELKINIKNVILREQIKKLEKDKNFYYQQKRSLEKYKKFILNIPFTNSQLMLQCMIICSDSGFIEEIHEIALKAKEFNVSRNLYGIYYALQDKPKDILDGACIFFLIELVFLEISHYLCVLSEYILQIFKTYPEIKNNFTKDTTNYHNIEDYDKSLLENCISGLPKKVATVLFDVKYMSSLWSHFSVVSEGLILKYRIACDTQRFELNNLDLTKSIKCFKQKIFLD